MAPASVIMAIRGPGQALEGSRPGPLRPGDLADKTARAVPPEGHPAGSGASVAPKGAARMGSLGKGLESSQATGQWWSARRRKAPSAAPGSPPGPGPGAGRSLQALPAPSKPAAPRNAPMAATPGDGSRHGRSTNSGESRMPLQENGGRLEAFGNSWHSEGDPRSRAAPESRLLRQVHIYLVQQGK